ncbi:MAG: hypothetical protein OXU23_00920 [Candidatus Poribacteria bacterium]|nr:hypothetical protein [Candidatus Poribacteria bacterium]
MKEGICLKGIEGCEQYISNRYAIGLRGNGGWLSAVSSQWSVVGFVGAFRAKNKGTR